MSEESPLLSTPSKFMPWTEEDVRRLTLAYGAGHLEFSVERIAQELGRSIKAVSCKADELGICNASRPKSLIHRASMSAQRKGRPAHNKGKAMWSERPHPRGMLGKRHSATAREAISRKQRGKKQNPEFVFKRLAAALRNGTLNRPRKHGSWKAGWRTIGGRRIYARSSWEANYARYLEFLKKSGEISEWEHEPQTFWFDKIKRGVRSYLPDFRVTDNIGAIEFHEVKGWNDTRSKTKAKRMKKYYPDIKIIMRDSKWYGANKSKLSGLIKDWE